jgi:HAD superfamily hydrolase (TIGR01484 family)
MKPSSKQLLCFDFDGTLVDSEVHDPVPPELLQRIAALKQAGEVYWAINTGRSLFQAIAGITDHVVHPYPDYVIAKEREIYHRNEHNRWVDFGNWNRRCERAHEKLFRTHKRFFNRVRDYLNLHTAAEFVESEEEPAGIVAHDEPEMGRICAFLDEHRKELPELNYERNTIYLRFAHKDYNKGSALAELARMLDITATNIFAAGDNHNDLSMLCGTNAHMVACPANAVPKVRETIRAAGGFVASAKAGLGMEQALDHYFFND